MYNQWYNANMVCSKLLLLLGLLFDAAAAIILIIPNLNPEKSIKDDLIIKIDREKCKHIQIKDIKEQIVNIIGLVLLLVGFILQIIGGYIS